MTQSDSEDNNNNTEGEEEQETQFICKKCPGKIFQQYQKDQHRQWHREQRIARKNTALKSKPGPRSKKKGNKKRDVSPSQQSSATLFSVRHAPITRNKNSPKRSQASQEVRRKNAENTFNKHKKAATKRYTSG